MARPRWIPKNPDDLKKYTFFKQIKDSWTHSKGFRAVLIASAIMAFLSGILAIAPSFLYGKLVEDLTVGKFGLIYLYVILIAISHGFFILLDRLIDHFTYINNQHIRNNLRVKFYNFLFGLGFKFFEKNPSGVLMNQIQGGSTGVRTFNKIFYRRFLVAVFTLVFALVSLLYVNFWVVIIALGVVIVYQGWARLTDYKKIKLEYVHSISKDEAQGKIMDYLSHVQLVKLLNIKSNLLSELKKANRKILTTAKKSRNFMNGKVFIEKLIVNVPDAIVLLALAILFTQGSITLGAIVTAYSLYRRFVAGYGGIRSQYISLLNTRPPMFKLKNLLKNEPEVKEIKTPEKIKSWDKISFDNVSFKYDKKLKNALDNISFSINKGEKLAIVGQSGSGKSTISRLLFRMYDPDSGEIKIGKTNIRKTRFSELYELMKIVPQENELINATVYENLKLGTSRRVSRQEILKALKQSRSTDFIKRLPKKLDSLVGPNGVRLSGGEKQRLCIARALLSNPEVLVFDEATSNLDVLTEKKIHDELHNLSKDQTVIAITHRISSMYLFDRIIIIDKGKIVGEGTHTELLGSNKYYQRLWKRSKHV